MNHTSLPYLSFVITSRNDGESSDFSVTRLQLFVDHLLTQVQRYKLRSELIIVEWNPPQDKASLQDVMKLATNVRCL